MGCESYDILMLGRSLFKWSQCPNMTIAVEHQFKSNQNYFNRPKTIVSVTFLLYSQATDKDVGVNGKIEYFLQGTSGK